MSKRRPDAFYKKAKSQGFVARSVFKLEEMDRRFKLLRRGHTVLDLGCAPGSWLQYAAGKVLPEGQLLGVDLNPPRMSYQGAGARRLRTLEMDVGDLRGERVLELVGPCDLVMSDMAPQTTGIKTADIARSQAVCELALDLALAVLKPGGNFVCKVFMGPGYQEIQQRARLAFAKTRHFKPEGSRKESREIYLVATCLRDEACSILADGDAGGEQEQK